MNQDSRNARRQFLQLGGNLVALVAITGLTGKAGAAQNGELRRTKHYQDSPKEGKNCMACVHFVEGKTGKDLGACQVFPGDTEISPQGYCDLWEAAI